MADLKLNENLVSTNDTNLALNAMLGNVRLIGEMHTLPTGVSAGTTAYTGFSNGVQIYDHSCLEVIAGWKVRVKRTGTYMFVFAHRMIDNGGNEGFGIRVSTFGNGGDWFIPLNCWGGGIKRHSKYACEVIHLDAGAELDVRLYSSTAVTMNRVDCFVLTVEPYEEEGLPSEYQEVEYLESTGTQYIDINVKFGVPFGFEIKCYPKSPIQTSSGFGAIFGCRQASGTRDFQLSTYAGTAGGLLRWGNSSSSQVNPKLTRNAINICKVWHRVYTAPDGTTASIGGDDYNTSAVCYLFGLDTNGTFEQSGSGCRIYYMKIWTREDELLRDLIPCRRKSDNVLGMYDKVSRLFYTNGGSGTFTAGPDIN